MSIEALCPRLRFLVWRDGRIGEREAIAAFASGDSARWFAHSLGSDVHVVDLDADARFERGFTATLRHENTLEAQAPVEGRVVAA